MFGKNHKRKNEYEYYVEKKLDRIT